MSEIVNSKEAFKNLKPPIKQVLIHDADMIVNIRMFTVGQWEQVVKYLQKEADLENLLVVLTLSLCDENAELLFALEETDSLANLSIDAVKALVQEILSFNRLTPDAQEDLVKNSEAALSGETFLSSPES